MLTSTVKGVSRNLAAEIVVKSGSIAQTDIHWSAWTYERAVATFVAVSICLRLICAANVPLAFDEALYWRYSKHLAAGFMDHPSMNPLMIFIGTHIFGDDPLGVRFMAVVLGIPASWAVWRAGALLFRDERIGATAALFYNLTVVMSVGSLLATSDEVVVTTSAFLLYALAKLNATDKGLWWLGVGVAFGAGLFSKYTTVFFAISILAWLVIVLERRKWLLSPWTYAGAIVALAIFSPVLIWNANHHWASAAYQFQRMVVHKLTLRYTGELIAGQFGLATPSVFVLGCIGLIWGLRQKGSLRAAVALIAALIGPIALYFLWHSLHERVQGNWLEPIYPAFVVAAALAVSRLGDRSGRLGMMVRWARLTAFPVGAALAVLIYAQALFTPLPLGNKDPTARMLGVGWPALAASIETIRRESQAHVILTSEYPVAAWLSYYLPAATIVQMTERIRWVNEPAPDKRLFLGAMLYACKSPCHYLPSLKTRFAQVTPLAILTRKRDAVAIESYEIIRVERPIGPVLDPLYASLKEAGSS